MFHTKRPKPASFITARRASVCPETAKPIAIGDQVAWFPSSQKAFHANSKAAEDLRSQQFASAYLMADANH